MADFMIFRNSVEQDAWEVFTHEEKLDPLNFKGHKFKVVMGGFHRSHVKRGDMKETLGKRLDISVGGIWMMGDYVLRCKGDYYEEEDQNLGTLKDFQDYFDLNNPKGEPSNVIYVVDHFATDNLDYPGVACVLYGESTPDPLTTLITGTEALFTVHIQLRALEAVA